MKTKKSLIAMMVLTIILVSALSGCNGEKVAVIDNTSGIDADVGTLETEPVSLIIKGESLTNYKDELVRHIGNSKNASVKNDNFSIYSMNNISSVNKFYYPTIQIKGYEMFCVEVSQYAFHYYFAPSEELYKENEYNFMYDTGILITVRRTEFVDTLDPLASIVSQLNSSEVKYQFDDDFIYVESMNDITAQIGDTWFSVRVPDKLNEYDYLHELCSNIITSFELISIK